MALTEIDRNLLRLACYEILHASDVPAEVTISEAVDLAKRFGGAETPGFVNAILDRVARECGRLPDKPAAGARCPRGTGPWRPRRIFDSAPAGL